MNALRKLHTALRPHGTLLDVHPEPQHSPFEIRTGDQTILVGQVDQTQDMSDITIAQAALDQVVAKGWFVLERELAFDFVRHYDSIDTWLAYRAERNWSGTIAEDALARGRALLAQAPGEFCTHQGIRAARYRRA